MTSDSDNVFPEAQLPDRYSWPETPEEKQLNHVIVNYVEHHPFADTRDWQHATISLVDNPGLRDQAPSIPEEATHLRLNSYTDNNLVTFMSHDEGSDLTVTFNKKHKYGVNEPYEPSRLSFGLGDSPYGAIQLDMITPSARFYESMSRRKHPLTEEENKPPRIMLTVAEGTDLEKLFAEAKHNAGGVDEFWTKDRIVTTLDSLQVFIQKFDAKPDTFKYLTPDDMRGIKEVLLAHFVGPNWNKRTFTETTEASRPKVRKGLGQTMLRFLKGNR